MTPLRVRGLHEVAPGAAAVLVVETRAGDRRLGFHIPPGEAVRVARVLGLARCRRTPIYELVRDLAAGLGGRVSGAILDARTEGICARLLVAPTGTSGGEVEIPCHPADGVGLALQATAPIFATGAALDRAARAEESRDPSAVVTWLERVRLADFEAGSNRGASRDR